MIFLSGWPIYVEKDIVLPMPGPSCPITPYVELNIKNDLATMPTHKYPSSYPLPEQRDE
jgi:hypothetical protein